MEKIKYKRIKQGKKVEFVYSMEAQKSFDSFWENIDATYDAENLYKKAFINGAKTMFRFMMGGQK